MPKQIFLLLTLAISFAKSTGAQANDWIEVRTPHFIIVSNAAEDEARNAALQFERMRAVFILASSSCDRISFRKLRMCVSCSSMIRQRILVRARVVEILSVSIE